MDITENDGDINESAADNNNSNEIMNATSLVISLDNERNMLRSNLHRCLSLFSLQIGCWHRMLE